MHNKRIKVASSCVFSSH